MPGGNFGHGFWSAGLGSVFGGGYGKGFDKVLTAAVVSGTVSKLTGGKFANGAYSAAFVAAINTDWGNKSSSSEADCGEPTEVSNSVTKNETFDLSVEGNTLRGSIPVVCNGSDGACSGLISEFESLSGTYGDYSIDIDYELTDSMFGGDLVVDFDKIYVNWKGKVLQANGIYDGESWSLLRGRYSKIRLNLKSGGYRFGSTASHELGHALGLVHQANATRSHMSYSKWRGGLTNDDVERLVNAYQ